jgi:hypothetical protein
VLSDSAAQLRERSRSCPAPTDPPHASLCVAEKGSWPEAVCLSCCHTHTRAFPHTW